MRTLTAVCLVVVSGWLLAGPAVGAGLEEGLLGLAWGAPPASAPGLSPAGESGRIRYYLHPKQAYTLFGAEVAEVVFGFYDDRFFAVYVNLEGIDVFGRIRSEIQGKYGLPKISRESRGELTTYSWKAGEQRIKLKHYEATGVLKLSLYHMPLAGRANAELRLDEEEGPPEPPFSLNPRRQREAIEHLQALEL